MIDGILGGGAREKGGGGGRNRSNYFPEELIERGMKPKGYLQGDADDRWDV